MNINWIAEEPKKIAVTGISQSEKEVILKYTLDKVMDKEVFYHEVEHLIRVLNEQGYDLHKTKI